MMKFILVVCATLFLTACEPEFPPKPRGYFRIDFPRKIYKVVEVPCPYGFSIPEYSVLIPYTQQPDKGCWYNIQFPRYKATIHLTYSAVNNNLVRMTEESHELAYKHTARADAIEEFPVLFPDKKVYGTIYQLQGGTASNVQFYLTDSTRHFLRGALYFNAAPNRDSLAPVLSFLTADIDRMIASFNWK